MKYYKITFLNYWNEEETVFQENKDDALRCKKYIEEVGLKILSFRKTNFKPGWKDNRFNRSTY